MLNYYVESLFHDYVDPWEGDTSTIFKCYFSVGVVNMKICGHDAMKI